MYHGNYDGVYPAPRSRETVRREIGLDAEKPVVGCLGYIRHYKGVDIACAAMERLRGRVQLLVRVPMDCWQQWIRHRTAIAAASEMNAAGSWLRSGSGTQTSQPGNPLIGNGLCVLASRSLEFGRT